MNILRISVAIVLSVVVGFTFTGCSVFLADPVSLMQPPGASGDLVEIENAIKENVSDNYELSYPSGGDYRNAVMIKDIDGDGKNEAIVFYQTTVDNAATIHMNLLLNVEKKWKSYQDITLSGVGIDKIEFADLCGDGSKEILVGNKMFNSNEQQLDVFRFEDNNVKIISQEKYTDYIVCNLGASKKSQILYFNISSQSINPDGDSSKSGVAQTVSAKLVSFSYEKDGVSTTLGNVKFDSNITAFSSIVQSKISDDKSAVFVDAYKGSAAMITEVFYYEDTLKNIFYNKIENSTDATTREALINCRDINGDKILEIPKSYLCHGYENVEEPEKRVYFTEWYRLNGTSLDERIATGVLNVVDKYFLNAPESWLGAVTIERNPDDRVRIFYDWDFDKSQRGNELFKIKVFLKKDFFDNQRGYTEINQDSEFVYAVQINEKNKSENNITIEYIKKNLDLI